jgi:putative Mn2+ efflux pump MntP
MDLSEILLVAVGLSLDAFAVAVAASVSIGQVSRRQVFRFSFHFGLFQAMMPVIGWLAGMTAARHFERWDHWIAFALLGFVGGKAVWGALRPEETGKEEGAAADPTRGLSLVMFSVATSIDALAVGMSLAALSVTIWLPAVTIGAVTAALTVVGMVLGGRIGVRLGKRVEILGGLILIGIGLKILISHLVAG